MARAQGPSLWRNRHRRSQSPSLGRTKLHGAHGMPPGTTSHCGDLRAPTAARRSRLMLAAAIAAGGISPALAQDADSNATPRISADAGADGYFAGLWSS